MHRSNTLSRKNKVFGPFCTAKSKSWVLSARKSPSLESTLRKTWPFSWQRDPWIGIYLGRDAQDLIFLCQKKPQRSTLGVFSSSIVFNLIRLCIRPGAFSDSFELGLIVSGDRARVWSGWLSRYFLLSNVFSSIIIPHFERPSTIRWENRTRFLIFHFHWGISFNFFAQSHAHRIAQAKL